MVEKQEELTALMQRVNLSRRKWVVEQFVENPAQETVAEFVKCEVTQLDANAAIERLKARGSTIIFERALDLLLAAGYLSEKRKKALLTPLKEAQHQKRVQLYEEVLITCTQELWLRICMLQKQKRLSILELSALKHLAESKATAADAFAAFAQLAYQPLQKIMTDIKEWNTRMGQVVHIESDEWCYRPVFTTMKRMNEEDSFVYSELDVVNMLRAYFSVLFMSDTMTVEQRERRLTQCISHVTNMKRKHELWKSIKDKKRADRTAEEELLFEQMMCDARGGGDGDGGAAKQKAMCHEKYTYYSNEDDDEKDKEEEHRKGEAQTRAEAKAGGTASTNEFEVSSQLEVELVPEYGWLGELTGLKFGEILQNSSTKKKSANIYRTQRPTRPSRSLAMRTFRLWTGTEALIGLIVILFIMYVMNSIQAYMQSR